MGTRRRFTPEEKLRILREHLENQVKISELAEKYRVRPSVIRKWKSELFEGALDIFSGKHKDKRARNSKEVQLQQKVAAMQEVIKEITTENQQLRKKDSEQSSRVVKKPK